MLHAGLTPAECVTYLHESDIRRQKTAKGTVMADHHEDHKVGSMDIREQEKTFVGFMKMVQWGTILIIGILIFMALANA
jgi:hypothetical protein